MSKGKNSFLFNTIAPVYSLFYQGQKKRFKKVIKDTADVLDLTLYNTILDVGCGTGALGSVLSETGLIVTGADTASGMLDIAKKKAENSRITFVEADVTEGLPFTEKSFDISIASYVAHGLNKNSRKLMFAEMSRVTRNFVIIHDYNQKRSLFTTIIEWLERGDYFNFIKNAENEMENCISDMKKCFSDVKVIHVDKRASWYICTPV